MQPDPNGVFLPRPLNRKRQQVSADHLTRELRQDTEVGKLNATARLPVQLEVTDRRASQVRHPCFMAGPCDVGHL